MQHPLHGAGASGPKPDVHTLSTLEQKPKKNPQIELRRVCQMPQEIQKCLCCFYIMFLTNFENWTDYCAFDDVHKWNHADMLWRVQAWDGESTNKCNSGGCIYLEKCAKRGHIVFTVRYVYRTICKDAVRHLRRAWTVAIWRNKWEMTFCGALWVFSRYFLNVVFVSGNEPSQWRKTVNHCC